MRFDSSNKTKLTFDTDEALKDFLLFLSGDIPDLSCFVLFCSTKLPCGDEWTGAKGLLSRNASCSDRVADVALVGWLAVKPDSLPKAESPAATAGHFAYLLLVFPCVLLARLSTQHQKRSLKELMKHVLSFIISLVLHGSDIERGG